MNVSNRVIQDEFLYDAYLPRHPRHNALFKNDMLTFSELSHAMT